MFATMYKISRANNMYTKDILIYSTRTVEAFDDVNDDDHDHEEL